MTPNFLRPAALRGCLAAVVLATALPLAAAPGAHGPNGEHLDAPARAAGGAMLPRLEANSDLFELVAELKDGQLRIYVDRYASNEPVADAAVEVEFGTFKALAAYQPAEGHYLVDAPDFLKALGEADEHALVFTILAGDEADLLNGLLDTRSAAAGRADGDDHGHSHALEWAAWGVGGLLVTGLVVVAVRRRQRRLTSGGAQ